MILLWVLLTACGPRVPGGDPGKDPTDLILVLVPGLRADPPDREGAEAGFTRGLDLAHPSRFPSAYAQSPLPFVSLGSLLTGRYAGAIPLCGLPVMGLDAKKVWCNHLPKDRPSLAGLLGLYGYRTALVLPPDRTSNLLASLDDAWSAVLPARPADWRTDMPLDREELARAALGWWIEDDTRPRLLVLLTEDLVQATRVDPRVRDLLEARKESAGLVVPAPTTPDPGVPAALASVYTDLATALGGRVGEILRSLPPGPRDRWTFAAGLHGVSLAEDSGLGNYHASSLYSDVVLDRTIRVPLVVSGPSRLDPGPADRPVELVDLLPTLCRLSGSVPPAGLPGQDLFLPPSPEGEIAYAEFGDMLALRSGSWYLSFRAFLHNQSAVSPELDKVILKPPSEMQWNLFDVREDPFQERDLYLSEPAVAEALRQRMIGIRRGIAAPPSETLTREHLQELRLSAAEGYW